MEGLTLDALTTRIVARAASDDSLDRLDAAITVAAQLDHQADAVVDHFVAAARTAGRSWTEIGARLGVSKQAARKRFPATATPAPVLPPGVTLRPRLQACLTAAGRYAHQAGAAEVGSEHLLAGLLTDGAAAAILDKLGVTAQRLVGAAQPGGAQPPSPLSAEAVCAIEAAAHHALAAARDRPEVSVGTEHLLAALVLDPGSRARRILTDLGVDIASIKKELACYTSVPSRRLGRRRKACAFCGAAETSARPLAHGPGVTICGTCARRALESVDAP